MHAHIAVNVDVRLQVHVYTNDELPILFLLPELNCAQRSQAGKYIVGCQQAAKGQGPICLHSHGRRVL